jgi:hypothetical protein
MALATASCGGDSDILAIEIVDFPIENCDFP